MAEATKKTTAVTVPPATSGSVVPYDYSRDAGMGQAGTTNADFAVPFIKLLQALSPEVADPSRKLDGATPGLFLNTATKATIGTVDFVPCATKHQFVEWVPGMTTGAPVGKHDPESDVVREALLANGGRSAVKDAEGKWVPIKSKRTGNHLVDTFYIFALVLEGQGFYPAVLSFSKTKIGPYQKFRSTLRQQEIVAGIVPNTMPLFYTAARMTSTPAQNPSGKPYFNVQVALRGGTIAQSLVAPDSAVYKAAREFCRQAEAGTVVVDAASEGDAVADDPADRVFGGQR